MGRPHKYRNISDIRPKSNLYHPEGIKDAEKIFLTAEEFEALRLRNYAHKKQTDAADEMSISQTTYSRIVSRAYEKLVKAFIEGYAISIQSHPLDNIDTKEGDQKPSMKKLSGKQLKPEEISVEERNRFMGFGCQECGYEWASMMSEMHKRSKNK